MRVVAATLLLFAFAGSAHAVEWRLGVSYASGVSDVADLYEDNLRLDGREANVDLKFPVGVAASFVYDWTTEWRTDVGVGPIFAIGGDVRHLEIPLSATIGYQFLPYSRYSPYVRGGVIHHFASGDQYDSSTPGLYLAAGVDFTHFTLELATDQSKVKFDRLRCPSGGGACSLGTTELSTYDIIASFYWRFSLNH
ncbi:MAG TPA: hypothetical protein VJS12_21420 [Steroidobacteraceae bacterium]|nr:hypothetical protein [Steroidobacteraceae bacterium]